MRHEMRINFRHSIINPTLALPCREAAQFNKSPEPTPVGRFRSAFAVDIFHPAWLSSSLLGSLEHRRKLMANILAVAGPGSKYQNSGAQPAGFWAGLWHGIISPITFIVSLFNPRVRIYETHNRGRLYDFGFIIGICGAFGGSGQQTGRHLST
jgi:hypothetical protein